MHGSSAGFHFSISLILLIDTFHHRQNEQYINDMNIGWYQKENEVMGFSTGLFGPLCSINTSTACSYGIQTISRHAGIVPDQRNLWSIISRDMAR